MDYIDLHTHSSCSDGSLSPTALVKEAKNCSLAAIALTDHDTMAGVEEALAAGMDYGVEIMEGVEISANYEKDPVHIIGYGLDRNSASLVALLAHLQQAREDRNTKILEKLADLGRPVDEDVLRNSADGLIGRPHIAHQMVQQRHVQSIDEAFHKFLKRGAKAFVAAERFPASETITIISEAGGVAVLAHPNTISGSLATVSSIVRDLSGHGLGGVEAIYPGHSSAFCKGLIEIADRYGLIYTGGSDFHGSVKAIRLGGAPVMPPVPYKIYENLKERLGRI